MSNLTFNAWRKPTRSQGTGNCVEFSDASDGSAVRIRDTKDRDGGTLTFTGGAWRAFARAVPSVPEELRVS